MASYLDLTIVSARHLKNVNWRNGDLKPYVIFWLDFEHRLATKPDESGTIHPVWNERFTVPINSPFHEQTLNLEIYHFSKTPESSKNLVGTLKFHLKDLDSSDDPKRIKTLELRRPSGRPHGKIRIKISIKEHPIPPSSHDILPPNYHHSASTSPFPTPPRDYRGYSASPYGPPQYPYTPFPPPTSQYSYGNYADPYPGYYSSGYYSHRLPPPQSLFDRASNYGAPSGPSAPIEYSSSTSAVYEQKQRGSKIGLGTGLAVGSVAGALGGLTLDEGLKYEAEKIAERDENEVVSRDNFHDYRRDY